MKTEEHHSLNLSMTISCYTEVTARKSFLARSKDVGLVWKKGMQRSQCSNISSFAQQNIGLHSVIEKSVS